MEDLAVNKKYELCYIDENKAYFTSDWENQWGDDWDDVPYEHNAERPYIHYFKDGIEYPIELKELYFEFPGKWIKLPCNDFCNSPYSVAMINRGDVAWIRGDTFNILAKTTYEDFIKIVEDNDGVIYLPRK